MSLVLNVEILGEFKNLTKATKGAESQLTKLNKTTDKIGKSMRGTLAAIGVGFSVTAITRGIQDTLENASDLEQQFGALNSVFKDLSPQMEQFAASLAPIGLSTADASRNMALLGAQLKGFGLPVDEAAAKTKELTLLAADLAATFGGTTSDAVAALGSLFRGEFDPIERYGVAIKKSDINARLAADGLSDLTGEALKQAEAQAALTLLFEKTTDAQGQAARESESYAAQQAYLRAESENLKAELGQALMPVMIELFKEIRDNLPEIKELIRQFIAFIPVIVNLIIEFIRAKDVIIPVTLAITALYGAVKIGTAAWTAYKVVAGGLAAINAGIVASNTAVAASNTAVATSATAATTAMRALAALGAVGAIISIPGSAAQPGKVPSTTRKPDTGARTNIAPEQPSNIGIPGFGAPVVPKTPTPKPSTTRPININNNINVKQTTSSAQQIANAVNKASKSAGTEIIRRVGTRGTAI